MKMYTKIGTCTVLVGAILAGGAAAANAHGYVGSKGSDVTARVAMAANSANLGSAQWDKMSLEGKKGFTLTPESNPAPGKLVGPADGQIASAGNAQWPELDKQDPARWVENEVRTGSTLNIGWQYTMPHRTAQWRYFITKNGWDQNSPLTRAMLQPLGDPIKHDGSNAPQGVTHQVKLPADHTGDHIILGVWDVFDTDNAFYNVIDVHISDDGKPTDPKPEEPVKPEDPKPEIPTGPDTTAPTAPVALHDMGFTHNSINLMWGESTDNVGVDHYEIQRATQGGSFSTVATTKNTSFSNTDLNAATTYSYKVFAVDAAGNKSTASRTLTITTKDAPAQDPNAKTWDARGTYTKGDIVTHNGERYQALISYTGYGDTSWITAASVWKKI